MKKDFERKSAVALDALIRRRDEVLHILVGARQTGKSTAARQIAERWRGPVLEASADLPSPPGPEWIHAHWEQARGVAGRSTVLLILDEILKVPRWSEVTKGLWDEDRRKGRKIRVLLLGSSSLLIQKDLRESLAGRFILHRSPHWSYEECRDAFGWKLDQWLYFGGYPGTAKMIKDQPLWRAYVAESLIESAIARDVLSLGQVAKPALLRNLFGVAAGYPAQILSYNKLLGTLQDAGNTVTIAHYLRVLHECFLISGLERVSSQIRMKGSSPKIVLWNSALVSALSGLSFQEARKNTAWWGRIVENAVGAHLLNHLSMSTHTIGYWRDRDDEVDYVVTLGRKRWAIEVKSGTPAKPAGLGRFLKKFDGATPMIIGPGGMDLEKFFLENPARLFT